MKKPFFMGVGVLTALTFLLFFPPCPALAADGACEALELRYQAELAIAEERARGSRELADAMEEQLAGLLQEYLVTRDGTLVLDTVDTAFVEEQFKLARAMEEPGVALALDVFSGPGTGYEHGLRTALARLAGFTNSKIHPPAASEAAIDAIDRQLDNRLEAKLDAKLDAASARFDSVIDRNATDRSVTRTVTAGATVSVEPSVRVEVTAGATVEEGARSVTAINTITVTPGNGPAEVSNNNPSSEKKGGPK